MPRIIDETYLSVHPRTALWWQQREKCELCANHRKVIGRARGETMLKCNASGGGGTSPDGKHNGTDASCLRARDEGRRCGPDALMFKPIAA